MDRLLLVWFHDSYSTIRPKRPSPHFGCRRDTFFRNRRCNTFKSQPGCPASSITKATKNCHRDNFESVFATLLRTKSVTATHIKTVAATTPCDIRQKVSQRQITLKVLQRRICRNVLQRRIETVARQKCISPKHY